MTLRELRESKGLSQREVARRLDMTQPAVRKIEVTGETTVSTLERYGSAIGTGWLEVCVAIHATRAALRVTDNSDSIFV